LLQRSPEETPGFFVFVMMHSCNATEASEVAQAIWMRFKGLPVKRIPTSSAIAEMLFATRIEEPISFSYCRASVIFRGVMQDGIKRLTTSMLNAARNVKIVTSELLRTVLRSSERRVCSSHRER
jgi:hypothetical protein